MTAGESPQHRFVLDNMLGKVAKWLRVLGFDTRYTHLQQQEEVQTCLDQGFLVITRNRRWCGQAGVICLAANDSAEQLRELVERVPVSPAQVRLLHRCILCNEELRFLLRAEVLGRVPDYVYETHTTFYGCPSCKRVYWPGSHSQRMQQRLQQLLGWKLQDFDLDTNLTEDEGS